MEPSSNFGIATGALIEERDDWSAALARVVADGWQVVELTAITEERLDALHRLFEHDHGACAGFERVTVHAPVRFDTSVHEVATKLATRTCSYELILHPDLYFDEPAVAGLESRAVFENMDIQKDFGRTVADLRLVFDRWPDAGFCLDVAHVWTNDPSLTLATDLLDAFGDRLRQLHVSGIEPDGTHRPTTRADLDIYTPVLGRCTHVPWLLEAELVS